MAYEPFIDDSEHVHAVDRERFVVLRPDVVVRTIHKDVQALLHQRVPHLSICVQQPRTLTLYPQRHLSEVPFREGVARARFEIPLKRQRSLFVGEL